MSNIIPFKAPKKASSEKIEVNWTVNMAEELMNANMLSQELRNDPEVRFFLDVWRHK